MTAAVPVAAPLGAVQLQALALTRSIWDAHSQALSDVAAHAGGMLWRRTRHGEHLVRATPASRLDGRKQEIDLGARGSETERARKEFDAARAKAYADLARTDEMMQVQAATNVELGLGRVPRDAGGVLRGLARDGLLGTRVAVSGAFLLFGYEAASGRRLSPAVRDPFAESGSSLTLLAVGEGQEVSEAVRRADASMRVGKMPGVMTNRNNYSVRVLHASGLHADALTGFSGVAVDVGGLPVPLSGVSPRAFVAERFKAAEEGRGDEASLLATIQARAAVACLSGLPGAD